MTLTDKTCEWVSDEIRVCDDDPEFVVQLAEMGEYVPSWLLEQSVVTLADGPTSNPAPGQLLRKTHGPLLTRCIHRVVVAVRKVYDADEADRVKAALFIMKVEWARVRGALGATVDVGRHTGRAQGVKLAIEILWDLPESILEDILTHELFHAADIFINGWKTAEHPESWKALCRAGNFTTRERFHVPRRGERRQAPRPESVERRRKPAPTRPAVPPPPPAVARPRRRRETDTYPPPIFGATDPDRVWSIARPSFGPPPERPASADDYAEPERTIPGPVPPPTTPGTSVEHRMTDAEIARLRRERAALDHEADLLVVTEKVLPMVTEVLGDPLFVTPWKLATPWAVRDFIVLTYPKGSAMILRKVHGGGFYVEPGLWRPDPPDGRGDRAAWYVSVPDKYPAPPSSREGHIIMGGPTVEQLRDEALRSRPRRATGDVAPGGEFIFLERLPEDID